MWYINLLQYLLLLFFCSHFSTATTPSSLRSITFSRTERDSERGLTWDAPPTRYLADPPEGHTTTKMVKGVWLQTPTWRITTRRYLTMMIFITRLVTAVQCFGKGVHYVHMYMYMFSQGIHGNGLVVCPYSASSIVMYGVGDWWDSIVITHPTSFIASVYNQGICYDISSYL